MEFEFNGITYCVEWDSIQEIYITDLDGNDVEYDYDLYCEAEEIVLNEYIGQAEMATDMAKDEAMGL